MKSAFKLFNIVFKELKFLNIFKKKSKAKSLNESKIVSRQITHYHQNLFKDKLFLYRTHETLSLRSL